LEIRKLVLNLPNLELTTFFRQSQQGEASRNSSFDEFPDNYHHVEQFGSILFSWYKNLGSLEEIKHIHPKMPEMPAGQKASTSQLIIN
jgi:hypothetical protein